MCTLALLAVLQSVTTGAYIATCVEPGATAADWLYGALLAIGTCLFTCHVIAEGIGARRGHKAGSTGGR
jgi:hypothetical protein